MRHPCVTAPPRPQKVQGVSTVWPLPAQCYRHIVPLGDVWNGGQGQGRHWCLETAAQRANSLRERVMKVGQCLAKNEFRLGLLNSAPQWCVRGEAENHVGDGGRGGGWNSTCSPGRRFRSLATRVANHATDLCLSLCSTSSLRMCISLVCRGASWRCCASCAHRVVTALRT